MNIPYFQVNAFTGKGCSGNPAGVCILNQWLPDEVMQGIAAENKLSETAFLVPQGDQFQIRYFTPTIEVDLCGHATLASGWTVMKMLRAGDESVTFLAKGGTLPVNRSGELITLDFPSDMPEVCVDNPVINEALGQQPAQLWMGSEKVMAIYFSEADVASLDPDFELLRKVDCQGIIATAPAADEELDFVSRFFAPAAGINEDPVTGSAHCVLAPYWATRLEKDDLSTKQISRRGGQLNCHFKGPRTHISGEAALYISGVIHL